MANFKIIAQDGQARAGVLKTLHGEVETPVYMPVGTQGTVKALTPDDLKDLGAQIILGNTYHLNLRPTSELIKKMGGLHKFMGWDGPILTDSGGFQAFSLGAMIEHGVKKIQNSKGKSQNYNSKFKNLTELTEAKVYKSGKVYDTKKKTISRHVTVEVKPKQNGLVKIMEEGVEFKSHLDGGKHLLTPERSIEIQLNLGADIILVLDELISPLHSKSYVAQSLERTHRWELRSLKYYQSSVKKNREKRGMIFGILQGVDDKTIRQQEARWIANQGFDGVSIGGSFGTSPLWSESMDPRLRGDDNIEWASTKSIEKTMGWITPLLPDSWPRHALGIGEVVDLFLCIEKGVDMFDCVSPTRRARNGSLYIAPKNGGKVGNRFVINIQNSQFVADSKSIDPGCKCYTCQNFSRSYLRHLFISRELLYHRLASIHNLYFMVNLVKTIRQSIIDKRFNKLKKNWLNK